MKSKRDRLLEMMPPLKGMWFLMIVNLIGPFLPTFDRVDQFLQSMVVAALALFLGAYIIGYMVIAQGLVDD